MAKKQYLDLTGLTTLVDEVKAYILGTISGELITIADIDEICGGVTEGSLAQSDVDELMAQLQ